MGDAVGSFPAAIWTPWQRLEARPGFSAQGLEQTLDGGQIFRWNREPDGSYIGLWGRNIARVRLAVDGALEWSAPLSMAASQPAALIELLGLDLPYATANDALPWRSDPVLRDAMADCPGLRIVRQGIHEALIGFICSATKRIPQIKEALGLLASRLGEPLMGGFHSLPTWERIAEASEDELRACKLGYRARYFKQTGEFLSRHPGFLNQVAALPFAEARLVLTELPGVGLKVADCVLLYGINRIESFPVDTWILQAMARLYGLQGLSPEHLARFGRVHFGDYAGLAQQYLFVYARRRLKSPDKR